MYDLTLTADERQAFDWVGDRYNSGKVADLLTRLHPGRSGVGRRRRDHVRDPRTCRLADQRSCRGGGLLLGMLRPGLGGQAQ